VHFHEVGALDAIVDIVGTAAALEVLDVEELYASPVANGMGMTRAAHGVLPIPAPAVVELLRGAPTYGVDVQFELTTPTGAALLAANVVGWGPMPAMEIGAIGFGAGTREIDGRPNVVQVVLGERVSALSSGQPVMQLEVNVDDVTGETLAAPRKPSRRCAIPRCPSRSPRCFDARPARSAFEERRSIGGHRLARPRRSRWRGIPCE
jgi:uncharacterized protein (DUF111 family)